MATAALSRMIGCRLRPAPTIALRAFAQAALPPFLLHLDRNALRSLPCNPLAVAWSEHAFETAFLLVSLVDFAAELGATGFAVGAGCAMVALELIRTTNAVIVNVFENLIVTSGVICCITAIDRPAT